MDDVQIIPILKPNKTPIEPASYRPISLLGNPFKIFERLVLNNITQHLTLSPFKQTSDLSIPQLHSIQTLHKPNYRTSNSTNSPKEHNYAIDIGNAFDTVRRLLLTHKILNTNMHPN